jgi:hypothetical protein
VAVSLPEKMVGDPLMYCFLTLADRTWLNHCIDTCPEIVEDFYEQLEGLSHSQSIYSQTKAFNVLSGVTAKYAGWLSRTIRENIVKEKEKAQGEIESELNARFFPPSSPNARLICRLTLCRPYIRHEM